MPRLSALVSSASLALLGSTSARMRELSLADDAITMPLPLSRRIGFVQQQGGTGASATAAAVASALATRRAGLVLGVNASAGVRSIAWQVGAGGPTAPSELRQHARTSTEAATGLAVAPTGLRVLDLAAETLAAPPARSWYEQVTPISRFFDVVCTDWGMRPWNVDLGDVATSSHVVCLVARSDRQSAEDAAALIPAIARAANAPSVVLALVDVGGTGATSVSWLRDALGVPVVLVPHDPVRASGFPVASAALTTRTRLAYSELAGVLVGASARSFDSTPAESEVTA
jgi:MinD-like ATPase involved in chromosome partitioning or flagellar assembly